MEPVVCPLSGPRPRWSSLPRTYVINVASRWGMMLQLHSSPHSHGAHLLSLGNKQVIFQHQIKEKKNLFYNNQIRGALEVTWLGNTFWMWELWPVIESWIVLHFGIWNIVHISLLLSLQLFGYYWQELQQCQTQQVVRCWISPGVRTDWIRFDKETHVPVMSEPARLQVTCVIFNKSNPQ